MEASVQALVSSASPCRSAPSSSCSAADRTCNRKHQRHCAETAAGGAKTPQLSHISQSELSLCHFLDQLCVAVETCFLIDTLRAPETTDSDIKQYLQSLDKPLRVPCCDASNMHTHHHDRRMRTNRDQAYALQTTANRTSPDRPCARLQRHSQRWNVRQAARIPVPINTIGLCVAATADRAPPPFAWPSSFVMMTLPTLTAFLKASA